MSSSPSSRRNRSTELSSNRKSRHEDNNHFEDKDDGSEFNTRGHGPPKIEGMVSLKVDNITQRTGVNLLKKVFSKFGDLGDIYVPRYPDTFASRGFAFVRYYRKRDAEEAMRAMNGERLDGRILSIQMARYARPNSKQDKHLASKRSRTDYSSDFRRNGVSRSYRRSAYSERSFSRRRRSRTRSRSRDKRKSDGKDGRDGRHGRSRSRSRSRSKGRSKRRTRYRSKSKSGTRSRSRSRSQSRNSSKSDLSEKKSEIKSENNTQLDEKNLNSNNNNKSDVESEKDNSPKNNSEERSHSNGR